MGTVGWEGGRKRGPRRNRRGRERKRKKETRNGVEENIGLEHEREVAVEAGAGGGRWMLWWRSGGGVEEDFLEVESLCLGVEGGG